MSDQKNIVSFDLHLKVEVDVDQVSELKQVRAMLLRLSDIMALSKDVTKLINEAFPEEGRACQEEVNVIVCPAWAQVWEEMSKDQ